MEARDRNGLTEREFLAAYAKKSYPRPYLTADLVLIASDPLSVLLIRRGGHPCLGTWAIPGGFVEPTESAFDAALRELKEETGVDASADAVHEIGLFSKPGRDPRGWVVTDAYWTAVRREDVHVKANDDAADAQWFSVTVQPDGTLLLQSDAEQVAEDELAFDHGEILKRALKLREWQSAGPLQK